MTSAKTDSSAEPLRGSDGGLTDKESHAGRRRRPAIDATGFGEMVEYLYFRGQTIISSLLQELWEYHLASPEYADDSGKLFELCTQRLEQNREPRDLHNALSVVLADLICADGVDARRRLCPLTFEKAWGHTAKVLLEKILSVGSLDAYRDRPDNPVTHNELVRFVSLFAPHRMAELLAAEALPQKLALIDELVGLLGRVDSSICAIVCVQHLFGSTIPLVQAICGQQIDCNGVFILGKPYSTNHATMWRLRQLGYSVHPGSAEFFGIGEYHEEADRHIASLLMRCLRWVESQSLPSDRRILLLEDGGRAIRMLHSPLFRDVVSRFVCVEQTRRGIRELDNMDLEVPVVNVAESRVKLEDEAPIIGESVRRELLRQLSKLRATGVSHGRRVLIVGFGAIGNAVAQTMTQADFQVMVYDADSRQREFARAAGFAVESDQRLAMSSNDIIIGCSGAPVMDFADYALLRDGTVLASASSSDIEFRSWQLRSIAQSFSATYRYVDDFNLVHERFKDRLVYLGDLDHPCHFLYVVRYRGKQFFLLNGGFPVNMDGSIDPIAPEVIQLTRGLLYAGAVQASTEVTKGLRPLDEHVQSTVLDRYRSIRGDGSRES